MRCPCFCPGRRQRRGLLFTASVHDQTRGPAPGPGREVAKSIGSGMSCARERTSLRCKVKRACTAQRCAVVGFGLVPLRSGCVAARARVAL